MAPTPHPRAPLPTALPCPVGRTPGQVGRKRILLWDAWAGDSSLTEPLSLRWPHCGGGWGKQPHLLLAEARRSSRLAASSPTGS